MRLLRDRNRELALNLDNIKEDNVDIREYAEKCKIGGERRQRK